MVVARCKMLASYVAKQDEPTCTSKQYVEIPSTLRDTRAYQSSPSTRRSLLTLPAEQNTSRLVHKEQDVGIRYMYDFDSSSINRARILQTIRGKIYNDNRRERPKTAEERTYTLVRLRA